MVNLLIIMRKFLNRVPKFHENLRELRFFVVVDLVWNDPFCNTVGSSRCADKLLLLLKAKGSQPKQNLFDQWDSATDLKKLVHLKVVAMLILYTP